MSSVHEIAEAATEGAAVESTGFKTVVAVSRLAEALLFDGAESFSAAASPETLVDELDPRGVAVEAPLFSKPVWDAGDSIDPKPLGKRSVLAV